MFKCWDLLFDQDNGGDPIWLIISYEWECAFANIEQMCSESYNWWRCQAKIFLLFFCEHQSKEIPFLKVNFFPNAWNWHMQYYAKNLQSFEWCEICCGTYIQMN